MAGVSYVSLEEEVLLITLKKACLTTGTLSNSKVDKLILTFLNSFATYLPICSITVSKALPMVELAD